ncbi:MAG: prepilin-type N-terminal cleavage/methylation domain-containing protein [Campylobacterales bacterium]|nr:prepilin-type N-terminal cleavage/methylation domain-containing protein [Campylobacterales bacterium]
MRRGGFTLIELIFSTVIIAIVFTVVPKLLFVTTKTMEFSIKEDGLFAAMALMGNIIRLPWDENTLAAQGKILDTDANSCNDYRIGGFVGSRNCIDSDAAATPKVAFGSSGVYGDIDDYDAYSSATISGRTSYALDAEVTYGDLNFSAVGGSDEVKKVEVRVSSSSKTTLCSSFFYHSANLGHVQINKQVW